MTITEHDTGVRGGPAADPLDELRMMHREGRLAADYPRVRRLLSELTGPRLGAAGRLLARIDFAEVLRLHPATPVVRVAITGHGTLAELVPSLTAELGRHGLLMYGHVADFDSYVFELSDPDSSLYAARPDVTLCVLDPQVVLDELPVPWRPADAERVLADKVDLLGKLVAAHGATTDGHLVFNTLPLARSFVAQLVDHRSRAALGALWHDANARLLRLTTDHPQLSVIDVGPLLAGGVPASDPRLSIYAKAHLSSALLAEYAREVGHLVRQLTGRTKKVLALDLDETVWGGVLGEDGPDGIEVAGSHRGEAFRAFQRTVAQLASQGVLLTAVSKNDIEPVREVLRSHPTMTLRENDFVRVMANWQPKHDNIQELAADLNLGVDSVVFVDDNPFECGLVRDKLPDVVVVSLDTDPALHVTKLLQDGWFDVRELTAEDRVRPSRYREELVRNDFLRSFDSVDDYLANLGVTVRLAPPEPRELPRVSQLTLRTNQFNLTTVRLHPNDVDRLVAESAASILCVHAGDRFGDNGLVGVLCARRVGTALRLENFLLSCRVFARGIEQTCLAAVLRAAKAAGMTEVLAAYRPSPKNAKVARLYPMAGFTVVSDDPTETTFRHDLVAIQEPPRHIHLTANVEGIFR
jgi:FkbH-like protein